MSDERQLTPIQQVTDLIDRLRPNFEALSPEQKQKFEVEKFHAIGIINGGYNKKTNRNYLLECATGDRASFAKALLQVATIPGMTLNPAMKMGYLVPRDGKIVLDPSYMALAQIGMANGVKNIIADVVRKNDTFDFNRGENTLVHKYDPFATLEERGDKVGAYCVSTINGSKHITVMSKEKILETMNRNEAVKKGLFSAWTSDPDSMWKKTPLRENAKFWPKSKELAAIFEADFEVDKIDFEAEAEKIREEEHEKYLKRKEEMKAAQIKLDDLKKEVGQKVEAAVNELKTMPEKIAYLKNLGLKSIAEIASMRHIEEVEELNSKIGV